MCINYADVRFEHVVIFAHEDTLFATGREQASNKMRIFLIFGNNRGAYTRNGAASSWERINDDNKQLVIDRIQADIASGIPVYKLNGSLQAVTGAEALPFN